MDIKFLKAEKSDISEIMDIIKVAQKDLKEKGIDQWQNNYPNEEVIEDDIEKNNSYILKKEKNIIGTLALIFDKEETYEKIYEGDWLSYDKYAVIHRIAIDFKYRGTGLASEFLREIEKLVLSKEIYSVKVDTHRNNIVMRNFLMKNGYRECGIIYLYDGAERIAYEKILIEGMIS